jgi:hypothetical protein
MATGYNTEWLKFIDSSGNDFMTGIDYDISDNYIYACGYSTSTSQTVTVSGINYTKPNGLNQAAYIVRYDICGGGRLLQFIDGSGSESSSKIVLDNSGSLFYVGDTLTPGLTGITVSGSTYLNPKGAVTQVSYLISFRADYSVKWVQFFDSSGSTGATIINSVTADNSGNVYVGAIISNSTYITISGVSYLRPAIDGSTQGVYIIKYNTNGSMQWFQSIDGPGLENITKIKTDLSGNVYVSCSTENTTNVYINGASVTKPFSSTSRCACMVKYNANGVYQFHKFISAVSFTSNMASVGIDISNNIYCYGSVAQGATNIYIDAGTYTVPSTSFAHLYIVKFNANGIVQWIQWISRQTNPISLYIKNDSIYILCTRENPIGISGVNYNSFLNQRVGHMVQYNLNGVFRTYNFIDISSNLVVIPNDIVSDGTNIYTVGTTPAGENTVYFDYARYITQYSSTITSYINKYVPANAPVATTNINASGGLVSAQLSWNNVLDGNAYRIVYGISGSFNLSGYFFTNSATISGLANGTYYNFYIISYNGIGQSSPSSTVYALTFPATPTGLSGYSQIESAYIYFNTSSTATGYNVYYGISGTFDLSQSFTEISGTIGGLTQDVWYNFRVTSLNSSGESSQSTPIYIMPRFNTVSGIIVISDLNSFDLSWNSISGAINYDVYFGLSGYYSYIKNSSLLYTSISGVPNQWYNIAIITKGNNPQSVSPLSYAVYSMAYSDAPTAISASNSVESSVVTLQSLYNVTNYKVYYGLSGTFDLSASFTFP